MTVMCVRRSRPASAYHLASAGHERAKHNRANHGACHASANCGSHASTHHHSRNARPYYCSANPGAHDRRCHAPADHHRSTDPGTHDHRRDAPAHATAKCASAVPFLSAGWPLDVVFEAELL